MPLNSRDKDTLLGHCARAIDYTLARFGVHGLPLSARATGTTAWIIVGAGGRGESVWMGFFLHGILARHRARSFELKGDARRAPRAIATQATKLRAALAECWRGDRYRARLRRRRARAVADERHDGASGRCCPAPSTPARGREAIENALEYARRARIASARHAALQRAFRSLSRAAAPNIRRACARTAGNIRTASPGSWTHCRNSPSRRRAARRRSGGGGAVREGLSNLDGDIAALQADDAGAGGYLWPAAASAARRRL